jgi:hypothetical protein
MAWAFANLLSAPWLARPRDDHDKTCGIHGKKAGRSGKIEGWRRKTAGSVSNAAR